MQQTLEQCFFQIHNRTIRLSAIKAINGLKASNTQTTHRNWHDSSWLIVDIQIGLLSFSKAKSMAKAIQLLDDDLLSLLDISALAWNGTLLLINKSCAEWFFLLMHCWHVPYTFIYKITVWLYWNTSRAARGGGGSFKNRKRIGEIGCSESRMTKRKHWWIWLTAELSNWLTD